MKTKEIKERLKKSGNGKQESEQQRTDRLKRASDDITKICERDSVRLISIQQDFYGQVVWVPSVVDAKK